jgi:hypothetical protein
MEGRPIRKLRAISLKRIDLWLLDPVAGQAGDELDQGTYRVIMLLAAKRRFVVRPRTHTTHSTSAMGPDCVKSPSFNLRVEYLSQFHRCANELHRYFCRKTLIEKTILRVLGSRVFSHSLGQSRKNSV